MGHQNITCSSSQVKIELNKPSSLRTHRGAEFLITQLFFFLFHHSIIQKYLPNEMRLEHLVMPEYTVVISQGLGKGEHVERTQELMMEQFEEKN